MAKNRKRKSKPVSADKSVKILDEFGNFLRKVAVDELEHMLAHHAPIMRIRKGVYRETPPVHPSRSGASRCMLTGGSRNGRMAGDGGDMHKWAGQAFANGRLTEKDRERILGHLNLQELKVEKVERTATRAIYFEGSVEEVPELDPADFARPVIYDSLHAATHV